MLVLACLKKEKATFRGRGNMFVNRTRFRKIKEKINIKSLCRTARKHKNEKMWTVAINQLIELNSEVEWQHLFCNLSHEKQNYCINMLLHRLAVPEYREDSLNIVKKIGEPAVPAVLDMFYQHVNAIRTTKDFEKLQRWLEELLNIIIYCKPPEAAKLFIKIYEQSLNQDVRYMLLEYLGRLGGEQAVEFILKRLSDESVYIRAAAIKALGLTQDSKVVPVIFDELKNNAGNSLYIKVCLEALIDIGDMKSTEILVSYIHKDMEDVLKEKIVQALLRSPYINIKDVENWFQPDGSYELQEILIKAIVIGNHKARISAYIIKCVTELCLAFYSKGNDIYMWGVRLLKIRGKEALKYLVPLLLEEKYKDLPALDILIGEFGGSAFPHLKAIYPLVDCKDKGRILRLMAYGDSYRLAGFLIENITDISSLFSLYIRHKDEEKILELIEVMGKALKEYNSLKEVLEPIVILILSESSQADYSDEERFFIKILYYFYKYFYFKELEDFFIMYLDSHSPFWRYAAKALQYHETDRAKKILAQYVSRSQDSDGTIGED